MITMKKRVQSVIVVLLSLTMIGAGVVWEQVRAEAARGGTKPPPLSPKSPPNGAQIQRGAKIQFQWQGLKAAHGYELVIARDASLTQVVFRQETNGAKLKLKNFLADQPRGTYFWAVRARWHVWMSDFGPVSSFQLIAPLLSRDQAIGIVRQQVLPPFAGTFFTAFMPPQPLEAGDIVRPQVPRENATAAESLVIIGKPTWFAFVDLFPDAKFVHDVKFVFVDAATGAVAVRDEEWWPAIDEMPIYDTPEERGQTPDRFEPPPGARRARVRLSPLLAQRLSARFSPISIASRPVPKRNHVPCPQSQIDKIAIVVQGGLEAAAKNDCDRMTKVLQSAGFQVFRFNAALDTVAEIQQFIQLLGPTLDPCDKFVLYISAHGNNDGIFHNPQGFNSESAKSDWSYRANDPNSITRILRDSVKAGHIALVIDACKSGAVIPHMNTVFANSSGVEVSVLTSADDREFALLDDSFFTNSSDHSDFTDHLVKQLEGSTFDSDGNGFVDVAEFCFQLDLGGAVAGGLADAEAIGKGRRRPNAQAQRLQTLEAVQLSFPLVDQVTGQVVFGTGTLVELDRITGGKRSMPESGCPGLHLHEQAPGTGIKIDGLGPFFDMFPRNCGFGLITTVLRFR
jgi:hypothetical protein